MEPSSHRKFEAATLWRWLLAIYWVAMLVGTHMPPRFKAGPEELGDKVLRLPDQFCVDASNGLVGELRVLLGADAMFA